MSEETDPPSKAESVPDRIDRNYYLVMDTSCGQYPFLICEAIAVVDPAKGFIDKNTLEAFVQKVSDLKIARLPNIKSDVFICGPVNPPK